MSAALNSSKLPKWISGGGIPSGTDANALNGIKGPPIPNRGFNIISATAKMTATDKPADDCMLDDPAHVVFLIG